MNNPIKTLFLVGVGVVAGCAVIVNAIQNNKTKIKASIQAAVDTWKKTEEIEEAPVVSTSPITETV